MEYLRTKFLFLVFMRYALPEKGGRAMENPLMSRLAGLPPVSREVAREILPLYDASLESHEAMVSNSAQETKDAGFVDGSSGLTETARLFRDALIRRADEALARRAGRNRVEKTP
jgi:hypothetical protein